MVAAADTDRRLEATIHGRVQGVGFRYFVQREAQRRSLKGWVRNLRGGGVQVAAEGPLEVLEEFLDTLREGPPMAWVQRVDSSWKSAKGEVGPFEVTYTV